MKIGSLFDGSGGFPLAGYQNGFTPVWASEVEPYPIRVTKERFPGMKHLGSVTEINGAEIEPVDAVTFGSPCQGLSVAGLQKGVHDDYRSVLFFEAIRIIKEMRAHDRANGRANEHIRPRFAVWENVPGAYSSNGGRDFQAVLQALCEIADPAVAIPFPQKGKWANAGCIVGDGYSIAWRTYDAQYWPRTPQRRKRIYLIADFASERAGEILFERESMPGYPEPGEKSGQGIAADAERSAGGSDHAGGVIGALDRSCAQNGKGWGENQSPSLNTIDRHAVCYDTTQITCPANYSNPKMDDPCHPLASNQHPPLLVLDCRGNGGGYNRANLNRGSRKSGDRLYCRCRNGNGTSEC